MKVDNEIKAIKEQVTALCDRFNNEYPEFVFHEERNKSFADVFNSLDHLNGNLKELYYINQATQRRKEKSNL